jgi:hypothetical protein
MALGEGRFRALESYFILNKSLKKLKLINEYKRAKDN